MTDENLHRPHALVTGAASGLGREYCRQLARAGYHVCVSDINQAGADETLRLVQQAGGSGAVEICDVTSFDAWRALREHLQADWPRLDVLVNNAGMYASSHVGALDLCEFDRIVRLNLWGGRADQAVGRDRERFGDGGDVLAALQPGKPVFDLAEPPLGPAAQPRQHLQAHSP